MRFDKGLTSLLAFFGLITAPQYSTASASPDSPAQKKDIATVDVDINGQLKTASNLIKAGKYQEARDLLKGIKTSGKLESYRLFHLARASSHLGEYQRAIANNGKALTLNPDLLAALYNNACYASLLGDMQLAISYYEEMIAKIAPRENRVKLARFYQKTTSTDPELVKLRGHGTFPRLKAALAELGKEPETFKPAQANPSPPPGFYRVTPNRTPVEPPREDWDNCPACGMG